MSKTPNFDLKVKKILDETHPGERECAISKKTWNLTQEELDIYREFNVPPIDLSPLTRMKIVTSWVIGKEIWWNRHAETGEPVLSYIHPDCLVKVLPDKEWHTRDFSDENADWDPSRPFIPQVVDLLRKIPMPALRQFIPPKNSVGAVTLGIEDSYMVLAGSGKLGNYIYISMEFDNCCDIVYCRHVSNSHMLLRSVRMHDCTYAFESQDCLKSAFLFDCRNCEDCFFATNQRNKKYIFFNEQLTKEEYERRMREINLGKYSVLEEYKKKFVDFVLENGIWPENFNTASDECSGEYLMDCVRSKESYWISKCTDCYYFWWNKGAGERAVFVSGATEPNRLFYCAGSPYSSNVKFSAIIDRSSDIEYCYGCTNVEFCFGCVGLKNKKYCILNKQYTEEEYWKKVDEIKSKMLDGGEYGQFFPVEASPVGYVFSQSMFLVGTSEEELEALKAPRLDPKSSDKISQQRSSGIVPLHISEIPDDIADVDPSKFVNKPILDENLGRNFSIIQTEYNQYKERGLPLPRRHFTSRIDELIGFANKPYLVDTACRKCNKSIRAADNAKFPNRTVYCQACYYAYLEQH